MEGTDDLLSLARSGAPLDVQRQALGYLLVEHGLPADELPEILSHVVDGIVLEPATGTPRSRLGGTGLLPAGEPWPTRRPDGRPLSFVAALDLGELPTLAPLPPDGTLLIYWDFDWFEPRPFDFAAGTRVYWVAAGEPTVEEQLGPPQWRFGPVPLDGLATPILGDYEDFEVSDEVFDAVLEPLAERKFHQLLGAPRNIQGPVLDDIAYSFENGRPESRLPYTDAELRGDGWTLLALIHEEEGIEIGDSGAIYLVMPEADLHARRFDRVVGLMQDH